MASQLDRVRDNLVWRIQALTPQLQSARVPRDFEYLDGSPAGLASGSSRHFEVARIRGAAPDPTTNVYQRITDYYHRIEVSYTPADTRPLNVGEIADVDAHSIKGMLRLPTSWLGYSDAHTTTDIGIMGRWIVSDEILEQKGRTILRIDVRTKVKEPEA